MSLLALTTIIATAVATVASGAAWHLWREARLRASARTRALGAAIDGSLQAPDAPITAATPLELAPLVEAEERQPLFASADAGGRAVRRLVPAVGVGALLVSSVVAALIFAGGGRGSAAALTPAPVDLLSMRHVVERADFVVRGLVRNPSGARARDGIVAVVSVFDERGRFLASARAPLDFTKLGSGEESPFEVRIPKPAGIGRYRLGFRLADGSVLPHVDLREVK